MLSLRIHRVSLHFLMLLEDMDISTGTTAANFNFTSTVVKSTLHIGFFMQSECWWKCLSWHKYLKHYLLHCTVWKFYLLEVIEVLVMLFCVLKWPARFTRLHCMYEEYFLSLDWALQSGKHHSSLCSGDVTHSTVCNPEVRNSPSTWGIGL